MNKRIKGLQILMIHLHSSHNVGDAALAEAGILALKRIFPDARITLSMNDPGSHPGPEARVISIPGLLKPERRAGRWRIFRALWMLPYGILTILIHRVSKIRITRILRLPGWETLDAYLEADIVVSAPGNFLYTSGKFGIAFLSAMISSWFALLTGKPLYLLPQSIGPLERKWERFLLRRILSKAKLIMLREPISHALCTSIGLQKDRLLTCPDLAFSLPTEPESSAIKVLTEANVLVQKARPLIGVTCMILPGCNPDSPEQLEYENSLASVLRAFLMKYRGQALIFYQVHGSPLVADDRQVAEKLVRKLADLGERVKILETPRSPRLAKAVYGKMDLFLGTRMHSNIFALAESVPSLAIAYMPKTIGIMRMLDLEYYCIDSNPLDPHGLATRLEELWLNRKTIAELLREKRIEWTQEIDQAMSILADDLQAMYRNGNQR